jgi:hypothetical protein
MFRVTYVLSRSEGRVVVIDTEITTSIGNGGLVGAREWPIRIESDDLHRQCPRSTTLIRPHFHLSRHTALIGANPQIVLRLSCGHRGPVA